MKRQVVEVLKKQIDDSGLIDREFALTCGVHRCVVGHIRQGRIDKMSLTTVMIAATKMGQDVTLYVSKRKAP
jgi:predicted XRE-type DNA-binding protein